MPETERRKATEEVKEFLCDLANALRCTDDVSQALLPVVCNGYYDPPEDRKVYGLRRHLYWSRIVDGKPLVTECPSCGAVWMGWSIEWPWLRNPIHHTSWSP